MAFSVSRISLRNIRSFGDLDLDLTRGSASSKPRHRTIIIGENGTGKTTLLRAIAVGLADEKDASGLLAEPTGQFVAEGVPKATIEIELRPTEGRKKSQIIKTVIKSEKGQDVLETKSPEVFPAHLVCGYGISRANEGPETGRSYRLLDSVYTLFEYEHTLIQTELTLLRLRDFLAGGKRYLAVLEKIKEVLGLQSDDTIELPRGGGVRVSGPRIGKDIPLEGWADGYRLTLAWILDLYAWAMRADSITPTGDVTGIVLLDELEQHLHPSMQVGLPSRLHKLLPHVQIIATTHSPLVALGTAPHELVVLKRDGDKVLAHEFVRDFHGYSVEDMLDDPELFDSLVYEPSVNDKLQRYRELASKPSDERSAQEQSDLQKLGSELAALPEVRENPALAELHRILEKYNL